ncbi:MAG TPA: hypothetical protein VHB46_11325 [Burkholderiales bacterium]|nr:hypothetical protein [Burkholderiales bacterium]
MNKILMLTTATLAAVLLVTAGVAAAATPPDPTRNGPQQPTPNRSNAPLQEQNSPIVDDAQAGAAVTPREREYLSSLKKCEPLAGDKKQACIDAARRKAGEM